ncbi:hypothetical protein ABFX02_08G098900 [Erythranthe guttata]
MSPRVDSSAPFEVCFQDKYDSCRFYVWSTARVYLYTVWSGVTERGEIVLQTSPEVEKSTVSKQIYTSGMTNVQDLYEATAKTSNADPCSLITIRLLSLQDKGQVYVFMESTDSANEPLFIQLAKAAGTTQVQHKLASDQVLNGDNSMETESRRILQNNLILADLETSLEQLISGVSRLYVFFMSIERMLNPVERIDARLQKVEEQLEKLAKNSRYSAKFSSPPFSCTKSESSVIQYIETQRDCPTEIASVNRRNSNVCCAFAERDETVTEGVTSEDDWVKIKALVVDQTTVSEQIYTSGMNNELLCNFPTCKDAADIAIASMLSGIQVLRVEVLDEVQVRAINPGNDRNLPEGPTLMFGFIGTGGRKPVPLQRVKILEVSQYLEKYTRSAKL